MRIVPIFKVRSLSSAIDHYTKVLDFRLQEGASESDGVVNLINAANSELQLTTYESEKLFGSAVNIWVDNVDEIFKKYLSRGLDNNRPESPVHQGPTDQTWGTREFYVTDEDGNTLRFCQNL